MSKQNNDTPSFNQIKKPKWAVLLSAIVGIGSIAVLVGWVGDLNSVVRPIEGLVAMNPTTALSFVLVSASILLINLKQKDDDKKIAFFIAFMLIGIVSAVSLMRLTFFKTVDLWLLRGKLVDDITGNLSNRMSPNTALYFLFSSLALFIANYRAQYIKLSQTIALLVGVLSFASILGYQFKIPEFYDALPNLPMAYTTAVSFIVLSLATLWIQPNSGIVKEFSGRSKIATLAVWIVPLLIFIPFLIGSWLNAEHSSGNISSEFTIAILVFASITTFPVFIWLIVKQLNDKEELKEKSREIESLYSRTQKQNERLKIFARIVSHNLRSNSSNLAMLMDIVKEENNPFVEDEIYTMLSSAVTGLGQTIDDLQDVVEIQTETIQTGSVLNVNEYVESALAGIQAIAQDVEATIENHTHKNHFVEGTPAYLESVFSNLFTNALKYRSPSRKPHIVIESSINDGMVSITVKDNGLGIDLEFVKDRLFGMYKTFHGNPDAKGIGLFLTKNHVEAMYGTITVESTVDKGSKFIINLPEGTR